MIGWNGVNAALARQDQRLDLEHRNIQPRRQRFGDGPRLLFRHVGRYDRDREAGHVLRQHCPIAREDQPPLRGQVDQAQAVGGGAQLKLVVPQDLETDQLDRQRREQHQNARAEHQDQ